jgi:hypothetical protein
MYHCTASIDIVRPEIEVDFVDLVQTIVIEKQDV